MTAKSLISILSTLPPETELFVETGDCGDLLPVQQVYRSEDEKIVVDSADYLNDPSWVRNRPDLASTVIEVKQS